MSVPTVPLGMYVNVPSGLRTIEPSVGCMKTENINESPSTSKSLVETSPTAGNVLTVVVTSSTATGASFTGTTDMFTVAVSQREGLPLSHTE